MANATNSIEVLAQRTLAEYLRAALPEDVSIVRSLIAAPPEGDRISVLPGTDAATTVEVFLGNAGRAVRDDDFTIRVWIEVIRDDLADAEDAADSYVNAIEDVIAENPTLGDLDGLVAFGVQMTRETHPMIELTPGSHYRWAELTVTADCRYE